MFEIVMLIAFAAAAFSQLLPDEAPDDRAGTGSEEYGGPAARRSHPPSNSTARAACPRRRLDRSRCRSHLQIRTSVLP